MTVIKSTGPILPTPAAALVSVLSGALYAGAINAYARSLGYPVFAVESPLVFYPSLLLVAAGAVAAYAFCRRRTVSPAVVLAGDTFLWIVSEANADPGPGNPYVGFVGTLPLAIGLMVVVEFVEHRLRERVF